MTELRDFLRCRVPCLFLLDGIDVSYCTRQINVLRALPDLHPQHRNNGPIPSWFLAFSKAQHEAPMLRLPIGEKPGLTAIVAGLRFANVKAPRMQGALIAHISASVHAEPAPAA